MGQRSAVSRMSPEVQAELHRRLIANSFSDYDGLTAWLNDQGYEISRSALHRHGQAFEDRIKALKVATDQAKAVVEASPDDEGALNEALIRLIQQRTFHIMVELTDENVIANLAKIGRMVAELVRASVSQKKWAEHVRAKLAAKLDAYASRNGLSGKQAAELRREMLGVVA